MSLLLAPLFPLPLFVLMRRKETAERLARQIVAATLAVPLKPSELSVEARRFRER